MLLLARIAAWSFLAFGGLLFLAQMAAHEIGFWIGRRKARRHGIRGEGVGILVGGLLGLLAFVLALTLSFANERFNDRRGATLAEANAVGTAWLRAKAIGDPRGDGIAGLLVQYTKSRIAFVQASHDPTALAEINDHTNALQSAIWDHVSGIVREKSNPVTVSLMASLNELFDATTTARFAFELRLPAQVLWLLLGLTLLGMAELGFQLGLRGPHLRTLAAMLAVAWTAVIIVILDLAAPRIGYIRTSIAAYQWTLDGFHGGVTSNTDIKLEREKSW